MNFRPGRKFIDGMSVNGSKFVAITRQDKNIWSRMKCIKGQMSLAQKSCPRINLCIVRLEGYEERKAN